MTFAFARSKRARFQRFFRCMFVFATVSAVVDARCGIFAAAFISLVLTAMCAVMLAELIDTRWAHLLREQGRAEARIVALQQEVLALQQEVLERNVVVSRN